MAMQVKEPEEFTKKLAAMEARKAKRQKRAGTESAISITSFLTGASDRLGDGLDPAQPSADPDGLQQIPADIPASATGSFFQDCKSYIITSCQLEAQQMLPVAGSQHMLTHQRVKNDKWLFDRIIPLRSCWTSNPTLTAVPAVAEGSIILHRLLWYQQSVYDVQVHCTIFLPLQK